MLDTIFTTNVGDFTLAGFLTCIGSALAIGILMAYSYSGKSVSSSGFIRTLAVLPAIVCVVILMVSGSLGASVAVAGTFSLVRFRSAPGTAQEISAIFLAMAAGLACGMGYPAFGALFALIMVLVNLALDKAHFGESAARRLKKTVVITIPEDLEFAAAFDELLGRYASEHEMVRIRTVNLGSLDKITYNITLKEEGTEKAMIDEIRQRNGNLEVLVMDQSAAANEL